MDHPVMSAPGQLFLPRTDFPEADHAQRIGARYDLPVWREAEAKYNPAQSLKLDFLSPRSCVPYFHETTAAAGCQPTSVWREFHARQPIPHAGQRETRLPCCRVPNLCFAGNAIAVPMASCGREPSSIGGKSHTVGCLRRNLQDWLHRLTAFDIPEADAVSANHCS